MKARPKALLAFLALVSIGPACGGTKTASPPTTPSSGHTTSATLKDFAIAVDPASVASGTVVFSITNAGPSTHEFVVFKSDLSPEKLPVDEAGSVKESGAGVTHIDEKESVKPGSSATLSVDLQPGNYVLICNLPGHYKAGMHAVLTVS